MRDGTCAFFQIRGIFHYFRPFKTEILKTHSLTGQILKQLSPSVLIIHHLLKIYDGLTYMDVAVSFCFQLIFFNYS